MVTLETEVMKGLRSPQGTSEATERLATIRNCPPLINWRDQRRRQINGVQGEDHHPEAGTIAA